MKKRGYFDSSSSWSLNLFFLTLIHRETKSSRESKSTSITIFNIGKKHGRGNVSAMRRAFKNVRIQARELRVGEYYEEHPNNELGQYREIEVC